MKQRTKQINDLLRDIKSLNDKECLNKYGHSKAYIITFAIPRYKEGVRSHLIYKEA